MKRRILSLAVFCATVALPSIAQKPLNNGYPYTQVPFTSVKIAPNTFWGDRLKAAREVTVPLAFSKCQSEGRYENFVSGGRKK